MPGLTTKRHPGVEWVKCQDCQHCTPDTEGISFEMDTGKFFLGRCAVSGRKEFLDLKKICSNFQEK